MKVAEICRKHGITDQTFYNWKKKYDGLSADELRRLKDLEQENFRLKRIVADQAIDIQVLKDITSKSGNVRAKEQCITYIKEKYPKVKRARACKLLNCSRSKAYYKKKMPVKDAPIKAAIEKVIGHSLKGRKKIIPLVQMQHPEMGSSKIRRVYEQNDLQLTKNPKKRKRSDGKNQAEVPMKANEEWDIDFMHDTLAEGKTIRSLNVIDPYNRECKGMSIRYSFAARRVIEFLDRLIEIYGKPSIFAPIMGLNSLRKFSNYG
ncbi:MAG: transposase [Bacteroidetes bacterium]|nr:transposase [Bacteroidota bacterium]